MLTAKKSERLINYPVLDIYLLGLTFLYFTFLSLLYFTFYVHFSILLIIILFPSCFEHCLAIIAELIKMDKTNNNGLNQAF